MDYTTLVIACIEVVVGIIIGTYFWNLLRTQRSAKTSSDRESRKDLDQLRRMRMIALTEPLSEKTRPTKLEEIVGQEDGLRALRAALCGPNPQHVIIYGPPGVGKTAAARVVLEEAKQNPLSPFSSDAKFVEVDATIARFDERGIADPLIGSVHDPIYQGAGALGQSGVPQPKPGAVTKAHGGILFLDEIGELHPIQMNKLLKVLEDRKVMLESAYYSEENTQIPSHIHEIFKYGLPADFRLVGATTRMPEELPAALRSRCLEIFFRPLKPAEIGSIVRTAVSKMDMSMEDDAVGVIERYATNGREAINTLQIAAGIAMTEGRSTIRAADVEWVVHSSQKSPRQEKQVHDTPQVGLVNGLAVYGPNMGSVMELEVTASRASTPGAGRVTMTGLVEEEEIGGRSRTVRRKSMAKGSIENVLTVLNRLGVQPYDYDLHINFPGGVPVDGPSAGITIAVAIYSAIKERPVDNLVAMTGEVSIHGKVKPVGGVVAKVEAARQAGAKRVLIPEENWQSLFADMQDIEVIPVSTVQQAIDLALLAEPETESAGFTLQLPAEDLASSSLSL
ncbi:MULTISPECIES: ATP-dependent protease LonB [Brevibacillus]|jgi:Lon-like ATP-dependent protease|uniref:endopeptidase La n=1 Tax=Brevibacillus aydinogluensis TaxID=927786 RepID=A0AA48RIG9_9BACL|nr:MULTISPECIES: ATP-dependent protease LonB [Brevibacillus]REK63270.1 MAG: ATP-dependent protease LonB [Brevibacillus sp.]MBR8660813.1 ATP-dependent protease LonB [Brevibacillus sp. NL20B1]MDT3414324.1 Lon-like ATP-dependent protease [Brevibacillus aydinogluensis]NNV03413.1 ATP-dependent protease LonB [Brevibacillus sp. MCWH]CAJ1003456.1 ATP-dependent protease LonB [Brevibacillus aydinogluensis]